MALRPTVGARTPSARVPGNDISTWQYRSVSSATRHLIDWAVLCRQSRYRDLTATTLCHCLPARCYGAPLKAQKAIRGELARALLGQLEMHAFDANPANTEGGRSNFPIKFSLNRIRWAFLPGYGRFRSGVRSCDGRWKRGERNTASSQEGYLLRALEDSRVLPTPPFQPNTRHFSPRPCGLVRFFRPSS